MRASFAFSRIEEMTGATLGLELMKKERSHDEKDRRTSTARDSSSCGSHGQLKNKLNQIRD